MLLSSRWTLSWLTLEAGHLARLQFSYCVFLYVWNIWDRYASVVVMLHTLPLASGTNTMVAMISPSSRPIAEYYVECIAMFIWYTFTPVLKRSIEFVVMSTVYWKGWISVPIRNMFMYVIVHLREHQSGLWKFHKVWKISMIYVSSHVIVLK